MRKRVSAHVTGPSFFVRQLSGCSWHSTRCPVFWSTPSVFQIVYWWPKWCVWRCSASSCRLAA